MYLVEGVTNRVCVGSSQESFTQQEVLQLALKAEKGFALQVNGRGNPGKGTEYAYERTPCLVEA